MNLGWKASEHSVRKAFQRHFTPSLNDGQALTEDPLATVNDHVAQVRECASPSDSSAKVQSDFLQHVQLLLSICRMVTLRLEQLKWDKTLSNKNSAPCSSSLIHEYPHSNSDREGAFGINEEPHSNSDHDGAFGIYSSVKADNILDTAWVVGSEQGQLVGEEVDETPDAEVPLSSPSHEEPDSDLGLEDPFGISSSVKADDFLDAVRIVRSGRRESVDGEVADRKYHEVQRSSPVREELDSNSGLDKYGIYSQVTSAEFLEFFGIFSSEYRRKVPSKQAEGLLFQLHLDERRNTFNLDARYYFERFLQACEEDGPVDATPSTANHKIPYSGRPFRSGALAQAAAHIFRLSEGSTNYARIRKVHQIADNWTSEGVLEATKRQEEENAYSLKQRLQIKREQMRVMLKEGIQNGDLEVIALFLL
ncbi:hypothetical protein EMWEY_00054370 [Eimeria maxima]|uniref:Uncharacterized protein n=1 Tax=Eimeria maxima TaxID=5804 RepID=U6M782_EIMMA|nr:hypothetical protein EMWEY_00054370 [Eimeria maxima]CDJ58928.1 hypothetical protein EMWEY_00054370 [Eimeria maxima]